MSNMGKPKQKFCLVVKIVEFLSNLEATFVAKCCLNKIGTKIPKEFRIRLSI